MNPASIIAAVVVAAVHALLLINVLGGYTKVAPNKVFIVSGRKHQLSDGMVVGCRTVKGGGTPCLPMLEKVDVLSLEPVTVELTNSKMRVAAVQAACPADLGRVGLSVISITLRIAHAA
jgi:uncharacterized membrane protein YqiK